MYFPNREELSLRIVCAFPKASRIGLDSRRCLCTPSMVAFCSGQTESHETQSQQCVSTPNEQAGEQKIEQTKACCSYRSFMGVGWVFGSDSVAVIYIRGLPFGPSMPRKRKAATQTKRKRTAFVDIYPTHVPFNRCKPHKHAISRSKAVSMRRGSDPNLGLLRRRHKTRVRVELRGEAYLFTTVEW